MAKQKTALVLSAGGMFGAYQAGAYRSIAERLHIDMVVGASVGALNGMVIASGCPPEHLIGLWLDPAAGQTLRLLPNSRWRLDPSPLRAQAEQLCRDYQPRIPFGVVVLELPWLRARLIQYPAVQPADLQATCAIPLVLPAVRIGSSRCVDGGLREKLPIQAALEMGATHIIAIDSLPGVETWWLQAAISFGRLFKPRRRYPPGLDLTIISPSAPLGDVAAAVFWKRENSARWIDLGARDAARALEHVK
jgi:NTE family protein